MTTSLDFPNNCSTNVYTLNDFSEIAYIVCTVATPPTQDPSAFVSSPENTLARLRRTERQFREASILAALDVEARQLFTFYKKVDIANAKDQKTLLTKFGFVLRSNTCTIAYKTAARLPDLMKPEQSRLYRLFTTAIVSSIKLRPHGDTALQPLGLNLYLCERPTPDSEMPAVESIRRWSLQRIDLQVVPSGHIILTVASDDRLSFTRALDLGQDFDWDQYSKTDSPALYLAPIGRIARIVGPGTNRGVRFGLDTREPRADGCQTADPRKALWKELLPPWLKEHMNTILEYKDVTWLEAEIPVQEVDTESTDSQRFSSSEHVNNDLVTWRTVFWPSNLCFLLDSERSSSKEAFHNGEDPMQFVQDWIAGTAMEPPADTKAHRDTSEDEDEPLFTEDGAFDDSEHFQPFGPPAFPVSQTIYPTPPEGGMTHLTPGLSSLERMAITPANVPRGPSDMAPNQDEEMHDFEELPAASDLPSFYDEDLFEEMPDDNFGPEGAGDEPNWDFFDRPGIDAKSTPKSPSNRGDVPTKRLESVEETHAAEKDLARDEEEEMKSNSQTDGRKENASFDTTMTTQEVARPHQSPHHEEETDVARQAHSDQKPHFPTKPSVPLWKHNNDELKPHKTSSCRRSSVYEIVDMIPNTSSRDSRYTANGDYWFDPNPSISKSTDISNIKTIFRRPPSSSSESGISTGSSGLPPSYGGLGNGAPAPSRQWTEYHPDSPGLISHNGEVERKSIRQEIQYLLTLFKPGLLEYPELSDFDLQEKSSPTPTMSAQKFLLIAHILVDQITQTSLISRPGEQEEPHDLSADHMEVSVDLSGVNTCANPSSLYQLVNFKADHNNAKSQGRIVKFPPNQIRVRRSDQPLVASISILEFWDTLNLQPESGSKNVTAFCVHPHAQNVADGCSNLLKRMTDTYHTCGLGVHMMGQVTGLTENGLISWGPAASSQSNLRQTCQRIGTTIASASDLKGTVLIYMISQDESSTSYLEACSAFHDLYESFTQGLADRQDISDIALQVVPQGFVASAETLVIPPQYAYLKLAIEVYNRLPPPDTAGLPAACGSAIILAKEESSVHFQLSPTFRSPLSNNGPCLHLAYSVSPDDRWITAAWTDECGRVALTMSYCALVRDPGKKRPRQEILEEMWEVSHDLVSKDRGPWRLAVIKRGYYDPAELLEWRQIYHSSTPSQKHCLLMLLSCQVNPLLRVLPQSNLGKTPHPGMQNMYGTPGSTPQASITSPDQLVPATPTPGGSSIMNAPTPPDPGFDPNIECDLTLIDPTEESWVIVLPYGVNQTANMNDLRPALATGLLMKRKGPKSEDGCTSIEISLISSFTQATDSSSETSADDLLEDAIKQYRGLATLGMTRVCSDPHAHCIPWHIATATRGSQILGQVM
ncbi:uncharacterized protein Z518_07383 [Rhinocladiella mackenziei CBS 650.93]|uniref:Mediator of RNA polymerase II transcription subunit 13 n=1 Tax=Rhinocladiella mackenziei CBS 650.93 TaxID=1442369 RepID=A0A0D2J493_9EURO|nr:uncharacterized protein Z518_07383 [Rhinocladiella mackenziei CBS 650.93]KIX03830.1 hypothetical protein Z518_07383 [Rhinocladiella mackenziei CBS 650.93]